MNISQNFVAFSEYMNFRNAMQLLRVLFGHQVNVSALLMTRSAISRTKTANGSVVHFRSQENLKIPGFSLTYSV